MARTRFGQIIIIAVLGPQKVKVNREIVKIAIDGMGGDYAPKEIVQGALMAAQEDPSLHLYLVGEQGSLSKELGQINPPNVEITSAPEAIQMDESASWAVRAKAGSSIGVGLSMVKERAADAFVSAGNSGAVMSAALFTLGRLKNVTRPAIAVVIPTPSGPIVLLDAGANAECKAQNLLQFAEMGKAYATKVLGIEKPSIGLLNIGEEKGKGNVLYQSAYLLLEESKLDFIGNIEGKAIPFGTVQVLVCDGFTGNVILKLMEGMAEMMFGEVRDAIQDSFLSKIGGVLISPSLMKLKKKVNYEEYGGAELLGVSGVCVISHGSSKAKAIKNAIKVAAKSVSQKVIPEIEKSLQ